MPDLAHRLRDVRAHHLAGHEADQRARREAHGGVAAQPVPPARHHRAADGRASAAPARPRCSGVSPGCGSSPATSWNSVSTGPARPRSRRCPGRAARRRAPRRRSGRRPWWRRRCRAAAAAACRPPSPLTTIAPRPRSRIAGRSRLRQHDGREAVQQHLLRDALELVLVEAAGVAEARVVDEDRDRQVLDRAGQPVGAVGARRGRRPPRAS